jgi:iron(III) transport system ATP-binding protein
MTDGFLVCNDLVKRFGRTVAVNGATLEVQRGEVVALLGPSGCGKTTLLRLIAGFERAEAGAIELARRTLSSPSVFVPPDKRRVSMVFQDFALFPHLSVGSNVAFGLPKGRKPSAVDELLEMVGLSGLWHRMPHQLSGGQQQRVALARALAAEPELVLLDEPFSNLDPSVRARVRAEVRQLIGSFGITAVFVTHDQEEALSLAGHVAVMIDGTVLQTGTPFEIYTRPASREVGEFVGHANFLPADAHDSVARCEIGAIKIDNGRNGPVDLMLRAEALALTEDGAPAEVVSSEYYGHDQMVSARLSSGRIVRIRLLSSERFEPGQRVGVAARGPALAFPPFETQS